MAKKVSKNQNSETPSDGIVSKTTEKASSNNVAHKATRKPARKRSRSRITAKIQKLFRKFFPKRPGKVKLHKSFKRSYREDYVRPVETPGILYHIFTTFKIIRKNWKLFLPLLILSVLLSTIFVGIMREDTYQQFQDVLDETTEQTDAGDIGPVARAGLLLISTVTTGGLSGDSSEAATILAILIFLMIWLVTVFLLRHRLAGHKIKLRDGLYNSMTPLISTLAVFAIAVIQCIPIFILIVVYSAAVQTEFLATPFYALIFFIFAALMILLSGYLLSSTLIALVAVTAPGLYPLQAINTASDLMMGRRIKFILRLVALLLALTVLWVLVMMPLILIDLWFKQFEWTASIPFVPICLLTMTCFTGIYISAYLYMYYRWMLGYDEK